MTVDQELIVTTPNHPFFTVSGEWVGAGNLRVGRRVWQVDSELGIVRKIEVVEQPQVMYNLSVAQAHTFVVGNSQLLVHNGDCPPNLSPPASGRRGAFRQAKRDAGVPVGQEPDEVRLVVDRTNSGKKVREYVFGDVTIQDHEWGHTYPDDPTQNRGPHFNGPGGKHYDYE